MFEICLNPMSEFETDISPKSNSGPALRKLLIRLLKAYMRGIIY